MKRMIVILFISVFSITESNAQRNYAQELVDLLAEGRGIEAKEFYNQHLGMLPYNDRAFDLFYKINMARYLNKPDSAAIYLEEFIVNKDCEQILGPAIAAFYRILFLQYSFNQQFNAAIEIYDKMTEVFLNVQHKIAKNVKVDFKGRSIDNERNKIKILDKVTHVNSLDGVVGVNFLKQLKPRVILDFDNMEIQYKN